MKDIRVRDIVIVKPVWSRNELAMWVTDVRGWGVIGDIGTIDGVAPYRAAFEEILAVYRNTEKKEE